MKNFVSLVIGLAILLPQIASAQNLKPNVKNEKLTYDVMFKWGFVEKTAGVVNLITELDDNSEYFSSLLTGKSVDLADNFYTVRDTLIGKISAIDIQPVIYERIAHEGGGFYKDKVEFSNDGQGNVTGNATSYKKNKKGKEKQGEKLMTATGITLDMLSALYYVRYIDYDNMKPGDNQVVNIFSGSKQERLRITYLGKETVQAPALNNQSLTSYHISFTFTYNDNDKKKSSDPIEAWIAVDETRVPYQLTGKLPIGGIKCVLTEVE